MRPLSDGEIIYLWDWGRDKHPIDRALGLLTLAMPDLAPDQVAALTLGQRNLRLLRLRELTLGPHLNGFSKCPQCGTALEFSLDIDSIRQPEPSAEVYSLEYDRFDLRFRLPNSLDLAAIVNADEVSSARSILVEQCVLEVHQDGRLTTTADLPETAISSLAEAVIEHDPQAETRFNLTCPDCGCNWSAFFDILSFFWVEISAQARQLLYEVHCLARAYGWSEADILSMSAARRQVYLELGA